MHNVRLKAQTEIVQLHDLSISSVPFNFNASFFFLFFYLRFSVELSAVFIFVCQRFVSSFRRRDNIGVSRWRTKEEKTRICDSPSVIPCGNVILCCETCAYAFMFSTYFHVRYVLHTDICRNAAKTCALLDATMFLFHFVSFHFFRCCCCCFCGWLSDYTFKYVYCT